MNFLFESLGLAIAQISSLVAIVVTYFRTRLHTNQVSNRQESTLEMHLDRTQSSSNDSNDNMHQTRQRSRSDFHTMVGNYSDIISNSSLAMLADVLKDQLEEMKQANVEEFSKIRKTIETNEIKYKAQYEETEKRAERNYKEMKYAMKKLR